MSRNDHPGPAQRVEIAKDLTTGAFGMGVSVSLRAEVAAYTARMNDDRVWKQFRKLSGTGAVADGEGTISTGATQYAYSVIQTVRQSAYIPGVGMRVAFTARFPTGNVADGFQAVGPYHGEGGFAVGYPGTGSFGFMHRHGRRFEIQVLTVTVAAAGAETVTLTLNGTAQTGVAVTNSSAENNAKEIAEAATYSESGGLVDYDVYSLGADVIFVRQTHGVAAGAFTVSSSGSLDGTWEQLQAGETGVQTWTDQADWSIDPCDGGGPSGVVLDPSVLNIYLIVYGWLGSLGPMLWVADPRYQRFVPVHFEPWSGTAAATKPTVADPRFPIIYSAASLGSTTDITVGGASCYIALEDSTTSQLGPVVTASARKTGIGTSAVPVLSVMVAPVDLSANTINRRRVGIESLSLANLGAKDAEIHIYVGTQSNLTGAVFSSADPDEAAWIDTSATALTGTLDEVAVFDLPSGESQDLTELHVLYRGQVLIVTAETTASTTEVFVSLTAHEDP